MKKSRRPRPGDTWIRKSTGALVTVIAVVNPLSRDVRPVVVLQGKRVSVVRLDRFRRDYCQ